MAVTSYRSALVTGASRGIGAAICRAFTGIGLRVYGVARSADAVNQLAADCGMIPIVTDVRDTAAIERALAGHPIDVLVNNAGAISAVSPLSHHSAAMVADTIAVNLTAPLQLMRLLLPGMVERRHGHVVNITSTAASNVFPGTSVYGAAKAGLSQAGRVLRHELAGSNVRLTEVAPGRVETDIYLDAFGGDRTRLNHTLYADRRAVQPAHVAQMVLSAIQLPDHVDVSLIEVLPTDQASGGSVYIDPGL